MGCTTEISPIFDFMCSSFPSPELSGGKESLTSVPDVVLVRMFSLPSLPLLTYHASSILFNRQIYIVRTGYFLEKVRAIWSPQNCGACREPVFSFLSTCNDVLHVNSRQLAVNSLQRFCKGFLSVPFLSNSSNLLNRFFQQQCFGILFLRRAHAFS